MKRMFLSGISFLMFAPSVHAQDPQTMDNPTKWDVDIKTPNAAAFERYGNTPVNLATGLPQINVPIYNIKTSNYTLPVYASYHAAGIKVDDLSGDIGLGWNLSAGFTISRTVRGLPDERPNGYLMPLSGPSLIPSYEYTSGNTTIDSFKVVADGLKDAQPDEFSFTIGSASGKFILAPDKVILLPDQDVKVEYTLNTTNFSFVLTDSKGIKYYFNDYAAASQVSCLGDDMPFNSSWHISKIEFPDSKEEVTFQYFTEQVSIGSFSQTKIYEFQGSSPRPTRGRDCETFSIINEKKLSQVLFPQGKLVFSYNTAKLDLPNKKAIDKIQLQDKQGALEKEYRFNYSYYNPANSNDLAKKLKLDSIVTFDNSNVKLAGYSFAYNGIEIPAHGAKSKDIWGYHNGAINSSLIPGNTYKLPDNTMVPGGDRSVNPTYTAKGVLNKITYPTGGYTQFEFENNTAGSGCGVYVSGEDSILQQTESSVSADCRRSESTYSETNSNFFTPRVTEWSQIVVETNQYNCTGTTLWYVLEDLSIGQIVHQGVAGTSVQLIAGHNYKITLTTDCEYAEANMTDCYKWGIVRVPFKHKVLNTDTVQEVLAGGLRVKSITDFDQYSNVTNTRQYEYRLPDDPTRSSGVLLYKPIYDYVYTYDIWPQYMSLQTITARCYTSEPNNVSYTGSTLVYRYVKETYGSGAEGGYSVNKYYIPNTNCGGGFPFAPTANVRDLSPRLLSTKMYSTTGVLQQASDYYYSTVLNDQIKGWKTAYSKIGFKGSPSQPMVNTADRLIGEAYNYKSEKLRLDSTIVNEYFNGTILTTKKINDYLNTASYYPYRQRSTNSQAEEVVQTAWRVADFSVTAAGTLSGSTKAIKYMKDNHLNDFIVESYMQQDAEITGGSINEYGLLELPGKTLTTTERMYQLNTDQPLNNYTPVNKTISTNAPVLAKDSRYDLELEYREHDANGKPRQLIGKGDNQALLLWGYGGQHLVAKIRNLSYNDLQSYLNAQPSLLLAIDAPANDQALRNAIQQLRVQFSKAIIEGYTYKVLTGLTSVSDANNRVTYYEYDTHGRLVNIKDADGNILKTHKYQYQGAE